MRKGKKGRQKLIGSIIGIVVFMVVGIFGINSENINELLNAENDTNTVISKQDAVTTSMPVDGNLHIYFIDVGQADSILIQNDDSSMLIDAGNNEDGEDIVKFIKEKGITKLDYVIGTHPHEDHIGGLDDVINSDIKIDKIYMPQIETTTKTFENVVDAISNKGLTVYSPKKGDIFTLGDANLEVMTDSILDEDNLNLSSITLLMKYGSNRFLFMGDSEEDNEKTRDWPKVDLLKVGHHGSNTSSSTEFLNETKPKYSIIMAGKGNSYGLPTEETLNKLQNIGSKIYRTDLNGTITATSDGENIEISTSKN